MIAAIVKEWENQHRLFFKNQDELNEWVEFKNREFRLQGHITPVSVARIFSLEEWIAMHSPDVELLRNQVETEEERRELLRRQEQIYAELRKIDEKLSKYI